MTLSHTDLDRVPVGSLLVPRRSSGRGEPRGCVIVLAPGAQLWFPSGRVTQYRELTISWKVLA